MNEYTFHLELASKHNNDSEIADLIYEKFNDMTVSFHDGIVEVSFHRKAESLESAISRARSQLESLGLAATEVRVAMQGVRRAPQVNTFFKFRSRTRQSLDASTEEAMRNHPMKLGQRLTAKIQPLRFIAIRRQEKNRKS